MDVLRIGKRKCLHCGRNMRSWFLGTITWLGEWTSRGEKPLKATQTLLRGKGHIPSKAFVTPKVQLGFNVVVLRFEIISEDTVHGHEDDAILHEGNDARLNDELTANSREATADSSKKG